MAAGGAIGGAFSGELTVVAITLPSSASRLWSAYSAASSCRLAAAWHAVMSDARATDSSTIDVARCQCVCFGIAPGKTAEGRGCVRVNRVQPLPTSQAVPYTEAPVTRSMAKSEIVSMEKPGSWVAVNCAFCKRTHLI